jgi:hypothetical protein
MTPYKPVGFNVLEERTDFSLFGTKVVMPQHGGSTYSEIPTIIRGPG